MKSQRREATDDLLVVTNKDRIHVYDGKRWSQLAIQPDVKKLVKRLPTAMRVFLPRDFWSRLRS